MTGPVTYREHKIFVLSQALSIKPGQFVVVAIVDGRLTEGEQNSRIVFSTIQEFRTKSDAEAFGMATGRAWIDERL
jgi:hypothetical protein